MGEEGGDGDLVGGVECDASGSAGLGGLVSEAEAGESSEIWLGEIQLIQRAEIET